MNNSDQRFIKDPDLYAALLKGALASIPIVGGVVVEVWNYIDARLIEKRIRNLESTLSDMKTNINEFKEALLRLNTDEHKFYAVRNSLKYLCLSAIPETADVLNKSLIELVMSDKYDMSEHACEIIQQLNADDINFLELIISFRKNGKRDHQQIAAQQTQQSRREQEELSKDEVSSTGFKKRIIFDRDIQYQDNTIFWNDFAQNFGLSQNVIDPSMLLNYYCTNHQGNKIDDWAFMIRSMVKLQNLGVLVCESIMTTGVSSPLNISRFHVTFFGQKIIAYIDDKVDMKN